MSTTLSSRRISGGGWWPTYQSFAPEDRSWGSTSDFRFYRYHAGQKFDWHVDAPFRWANGEMNPFTFMVYLNGSYRGGATAFHDSAEVVGERGMALLFEHGLMHQGAEVTQRVKYALRSDVMYGVVGRFTG